MAIWPELRASFRVATGRDLAKADLSEFLEHTLWYIYNAHESVYNRREALMKALHGEAVDGAEFEDQAGSLYSQLDEMERQLREGVE